MTKSILLEPIEFGPYRLSNRIVMSPMTRNRSPNELPNALNAEYYAQRATAGLIISESTAISAEGLGWPETPGIFTDAQEAGWKRVTDGVHQRGGRMFLQLWHCGRNSHPLTQPHGQAPIGPSAVQPTGTVRTREGRLPLHVPRELPANEVGRLIDDYRAAARRAMAAGFDGVEVHAANGYLLDQFLKDSSNLRADRYGGAPLNRCRLMIEVVTAVAEIWGAERVGVRLSPVSPSNYQLVDSDPELLMVTALTELSRLGICYVAMVEGSSNAMPATHELDYGRLRKHFTGLYIANNAFTQARAEQALQERRADLISFGRLYIANPDLVRRFTLNAPLNPLNADSIYTSDHRGYTDYPALADEPATAA
ncbi:alkene reductase [Variovorax ginsengisoli]|uniref:Alkene reductase n=1 Tax=Variovorax ginsengisoli TaxID=363844 RepID=A0ABT8SEW8_9BURK|nr:alkene reductase [Variovorax ginsengisoli]MDN8618279.1 alkene reductase [Variovorax ginsengisoli]MDO1537449.1 alkene reductase [Variovorax ginsengisoli]